MDLRGFSIHGGMGITRGLDGRGVVWVVCGGGTKRLRNVCGVSEESGRDDVALGEVDGKLQWSAEERFGSVLCRGSPCEGAVTWSGNAWRAGT